MPTKTMNETRIQVWKDGDTATMQVTPTYGQPVIHMFSNKDLNLMEQILSALEGRENPIILIMNAVKEQSSDG